MEFTADRDNHRYWLGKRRLYSPTDVLQGLKMVDVTWFTAVARMRGSAVHDACHYLDEGDLDWGSLAAIEKSLGCPISGYVRGWQKFIRETGFKPYRIEVAGYHPTRLYAGRPDRFGVFPDGVHAVVDLKTGAVPDWCGLQTAAYDEMVPLPDGVKSRKRYGVQLTEDGDYKLVPFTDTTDGLTFLYMHHSFLWGVKHGRYADV